MSAGACRPSRRESPTRLSCDREAAPGVAMLELRQDAAASKFAITGSWSFVAIFHNIEAIYGKRYDLLRFLVCNKRVRTVVSNSAQHIVHAAN